MAKVDFDKKAILIEPHNIPNHYEAYGLITKLISGSCYVLAFEDLEKRKLFADFGISYYVEKGEGHNENNIHLINHNFIMFGVFDRNMKFNEMKNICSISEANTKKNSIINLPERFKYREYVSKSYSDISSIIIDHTYMNHASDKVYDSSNLAVYKIVICNNINFRLYVECMVRDNSIKNYVECFSTNSYGNEDNSCLEGEVISRVEFSLNRKDAVVLNPHSDFEYMKYNFPPLFMAIKYLKIEISIED